MSSQNIEDHRSKSNRVPYSDSFPLNLLSPSIGIHLLSRVPYLGRVYVPFLKLKVFNHQCWGTQK